VNRRPDFFIVGAPKCGTTAMDQYLREHPQIYMCPAKDCCFFGQDQEFTIPRLSFEGYLNLFRKVRDEKRVGESSVNYLVSQSAAREIEAFSPNASIIVMLRNPVDMLYSLHSQYLYDGNEDIPDFEEALNAEPARKAGRRIPSTMVFREGLYYRGMVRYTEQVERYFRVFGRHRVLVLLFDDFRRNTEETYRSTLEFLEVDSSFRPRFIAKNPNKVIRSNLLRDLALRPRGVPRIIAKAVVPARLRSKAVDLLWRVNTWETPRAAMKPALRKSLTEEFRGEVSRLSDLIARDLSAWLEVGHNGGQLG
jgi:hypothetical protein